MMAPRNVGLLAAGRPIRLSSVLEATGFDNYEEYVSLDGDSSNE